MRWANQQALNMVIFYGMFAFFFWGVLHVCMLCGLECCAEPVWLTHACSPWQCCILGKPNCPYSTLFEATTAPEILFLSDVFCLERLPLPRSILCFSGDVGNSTLPQGLRNPKKIWKILKFSAFQSPKKNKERPQLNPLVSLVLPSVFFHRFLFHFPPFPCIHEVCYRVRKIMRCCYQSACFGRWRWHTWCPWTKQWLQGVGFLGGGGKHVWPSNGGCLLVEDQQYLKWLFFGVYFGMVWFNFLISGPFIFEPQSCLK